jgi:hypothetical protein
VDDPDLENGSCKTKSALGANSNSVWRARHAFSIQVELDAGRRYVADFAWSGFSVVIARESGP